MTDLSQQLGTETTEQTDGEDPERIRSCGQCLRTTLLIAAGCHFLCLTVWHHSQDGHIGQTAYFAQPLDGDDLVYYTKYRIISPISYN